MFIDLLYLPFVGIIIYPPKNYIRLDIKFIKRGYKIFKYPDFIRNLSNKIYAKILYPY